MRLPIATAAVIGLPLAQPIRLTAILPSPPAGDPRGLSELAGRTSFAGAAKLAGAGMMGAGWGVSATDGAGGGIDGVGARSARLIIFGTMGAVVGAGAGASAMGVVDAGPLEVGSRLMTFGTMMPVAGWG
jgi:hypothetical protein